MINDIEHVPVLLNEAINALSLMEQDKENPISILVVVDQSEAVIGMLRMHEVIQSGLKT